VDRIGLGFDRHVLTGGRACILGGVQFTDCPVGPLGHSDGDAVCHAIADAILGAAGLGDIGGHFPDTDPQWQDADSIDLLRRCAAKISGAGWRVVNVDCTVFTERPHIAPRAAEMAQRLAAALATDAGTVNVKATRGEGLGPEGRGECVSAMAVALLTRAEPEPPRSG
jgi:2-C-methyl-D-erythritol 2,4-cyclodiphosphate synthase